MLGQVGQLREAILLASSRVRSFAADLLPALLKRVSGADRRPALHKRVLGSVWLRPMHRLCRAAT